MKKSRTHSVWTLTFCYNNVDATDVFVISGNVSETDQTYALLDQVVYVGVMYSSSDVFPDLRVVSVGDDPVDNRLDLLDVQDSFLDTKLAQIYLAKFPCLLLVFVDEVFELNQVHYYLNSMVYLLLYIKI